MFLRRHFVGQPILLVALLAVPAAALAENSPREIRARIDSVSTLLAAGRSDDAVAALEAGIEGLRALQAEPRPPSGLRVLVERAVAARRALEKAGLDVTSLEIPAPNAPAPGKPAPAPARPRPAAGISFSSQVAPLLVRSCGGCHIAGRRGNFQMASYESLMRSGMVQKGAGNASRLVEVILSGDMPRGGGRVSPAEIGILMAWIDGGAQCDADPLAPLAAVAASGAGPPAAEPPPAVRPAPLKPGEIAFSTAIAPLLLERCLACHAERNPEAGFQVTSLESLVRGGRSGAAVVAGRGADSLLVKKLRGVGIQGQRMPLNRPPLPDAQIELVERWIDQGGRIDLLTAGDALETVVAAARARQLSGEQLTAARLTAAEKFWDRMIPDESAVVERRTGIAVVGNLPAARLQALAGEAADLAAGIRRELSPSGDELLKGGIVLYAFRNSFDYSALWQEILGRERPRGLKGHAGSSGDLVYGAVLLAGTDEAGDDVRLLVAEQIAAAALLGRGLPAWFSQGAGRAVAARLVPKASLVRDWQQATAGALKQLGSADDFFSGHADPLATAVAAGGFVTSLSGAGKLGKLLALVDGGDSFEQAFGKVFRGPPAQLFTAWAARNAGR